MTTSMFTAAGPKHEPVIAALPAPAKLKYQLTESNWNYTDKELRGSLLDYIGPMDMDVDAGGSAESSKLDQCVRRLTAQVGTAPFAVDQGFYNGQEANVMVFWHNQPKNQVLVHVVGPECDEVRRPAFTHWK
jgi:hypothetical protein